MNLPTTILPPRTLSSFNTQHPHTDTQPTTTATTYPTSSPEQALEMHTRNATVTRTTKPTLMTRLKGRNAKSRTVKTTETVTSGTTTRTTRSGGFGGRSEPVVHHKRHASIGDKISGAMLKLKGSITRRPGVKAAGTRRMHGTDGRGSHRVY